MSKLVIVSDLHADRTTLGISRFEEVESAMQQAVDFAIENDVDYFACLGDIADPDSGGATFRAIGLMIDCSMRLHRKKIESIWLAGNHDVYEDGTGATCLTPLADVVRSLDMKDVHVAEKPLLVSNGPHGLAVLALPYVPLSHTYDPRKVATDAIASLRASAGDAPLVVLTHLMLPGIVPGEETLDMPRGRDVAFPIEETKSAVARFAGHYHQRQTTTDGIMIPGSLCRFTFEHDEKSEPGFLYVEI